jgi:predicted MPP superfamily phosphohydrolase
MSRAEPRSAHAGERATRWVVGAQVVLNAVLLAVGIWLGLARGRLPFLLALVPLVFVPFSYARVRLHRFLAPHLTPSLVGVLVATGLLLDATMVAQLLSARQPIDLTFLNGPGVTWIGAVWFSAHAFLVLGYAVAGLIRLVRAPVRRVLSAVRPPPSRVDELSIGRRELLQKAGLFSVAVPFGISLSGVPLSYDFRVERREIVLPFWPTALDGLRVVHLSDIHVGGSMDRDRLLQVVHLTNECHPDLVLHTGDFLTHRAGDFAAPLYEALAGIQAPYGQWACFGNHDYDDPRRHERRLRESGVVVLRDRVDAVSLRGTALEIGGLDYVFGRAQRAATHERSIAGWGPRGGAPRILLSHDPSAFAELPTGCADLVLSGHTHGGHVGVQLGSSHAITVVGLLGLPDQGLFVRDDMRMYVTRCVGFYGYPMRIGIPPEIALLVLRSPRAV